MKHEFTCYQCGLHKTHETPEAGGSTGYGEDLNGDKICFDCCGLNDAKALRELPLGKKIIMYWDGKHITNWPGTLKIKGYYKYGNHNWAGIVTFIYFQFEGKDYLAKQYGRNDQLAHIRKLKAFK